MVGGEARGMSAGRRLLVVLGILALVAPLFGLLGARPGGQVAAADGPPGCVVDGQHHDDWVVIDGVCVPPTDDDGGGGDTGPKNGPYVIYKQTGCGHMLHPNDIEDKSKLNACAGMRCTDYDEPIYRWHRTVWYENDKVVRKDPWTTSGAGCPADPNPTPNPEAVRFRLQQMLQKATPQFDPDNGQVLTGFAMNFYTEVEGIDEGIVVQGLPLTVRAEPVLYKWHFGNETDSTTDPGKPYPNGTYHYTFKEPGPYPVTVDVVYEASFTFNGDEQELGQITVDGGPVGDVHVYESIPVLTGQ